MTACPASETLALLLQERLLPPLRERVEAHVEGCATCQAELERLSSEATPLAIAHPERAAAPGGLAASDSFLARIGARAAFPRPPTAPGSGWPKIEGYEILGELGSGGMGRVYRARHLKLGRQVALKVIKHGPDADQLHVRLGQEAMALARLRHPNIVQVYDVGESDGLAYLALELVEGTTLSAWMNGLPQPSDVAAHLAWVLAQGVDYAHRNGILHRDLKPSNVLIESPADVQEAAAEGSPPRIKIADFGLAKAIAEGDPLGGAHTTTGVLIGTPQYMAPEQGSGLRGPVGPGADVYALGVILYELLAGRPPFRGETPLKTILQVVHEAPPSLSRFRPGIPLDLATICMKCLEKSPSRRYASAGALAEDLRRFLAREPIAARPVGPMGRLARWGQRKPRIAAAAGAAIAGTALAFGLVFWQWRSAEASRAEAVELAASEASATAEARAERDKAERARQEAERARQEAERARLVAERTAAELILDESIAACERGEVEAGTRGFARALRGAEGAGQGDLAAACRANIACWSRRLSTISASPPFGSSATSVAWSPDGKRLLVGQWIGVGGRGDMAYAQLWDPDGWKPIGPKLVHGGGVYSVAWSPDGRLLLTGAVDGSVRTWDAATGEPAGPMLRELKKVYEVAFHPDGKRFAAGGEAPGGKRGEVRIWEIGGGEKAAAATFSFPGMVDTIAFSPDGKTLATASRIPEAASESAYAEVCQWDLASKERKGPRLIHFSPVRALAYSPDGKRLATGGGDRVATLWDVEAGTRAGLPFLHPEAISSMAFSSDGKTLAIGGGGYRQGKVIARRLAGARLWDVETGKLRLGPLGHADIVHDIAISHDGERVATACRDGHAYLFRTEPYLPAERTLPFACGSLNFVMDGRRLIASGWREKPVSGITQLLDPATGAPLAPPIEHPAAITAVAVERNTGAYAVAMYNGTARVFDPVAGRPLGPPLKNPGLEATLRDYPPTLAFGPGGERLMVTVPGKASRLWDWRAGELAWQSRPGDVSPAAMPSPDGRMILTNRGREGLHLLDIAGEAPPRAVWAGGAREFLSCGFSPDGRFAIAGDSNRAIRCWDLAAGRAAEATLDLSAVERAGFLGDGPRAYAVAGTAIWGQGHVYLWDPFSGDPPKQLPHLVSVAAVAFNPDRRFLVTGGWSGGARLWDVATGYQIGPELAGAGNVVAIACSPDGRSVAAADEENNLSIWRIPLPGPESSP